MEAILQIFKSGGLVMYPLLGLSIYSVAMILERSLFWLKISRQQEQIIKQLLNLYQDNTEDALKMLQRHLNLPMARIFAVALSLQRSTPTKFKLALETAAQAEIPVLKRFNNSFETVISLSPLLGLLGTVTGLITSLSSLKLGDIESSQAAGVTGGIGEALISTAAGLVVAIATLFFASFFRGLYLRQLSLIQEVGGQLELIHLDQHDRQEAYTK
jgi:biopolymer transport protein ExbB